jgi:cytochrome o ubiquinol oxidase subunit 1
MTGPIVGMTGAATAFGLVWHMWWLAIAGTLVVIGAVIARSFARDVDRVIPAAEVARTQARWLRAVAKARAVPRQVETTAANEGLAEVSA